MPYLQEGDEMARPYRRNAAGRFAGSNAKGGVATTVAQDRAAHDMVRVLFPETNPEPRDA
jgi:hypothetical protein